MSESAMYHRSIALHLDAPAADRVRETGQITLLASTPAAVNWGGWREILAHGPDAVDHATARALLVNHDPNQIAGRLDTILVDDVGSQVEATIDPDARLRSGVSVQRAVESGALRGVSIGYTYDDADTTWDDTTSTLTVNRWRLLEASLTPIPADAGAGVRSLPAAAEKHAASTARSAPAARQANQEPAVEKNTPAQATAPQADVVAAPDSLTIARHAESLGLRASDYLGKANPTELMLADVAKSRASAPVAPMPRVDVTADAGDKLRTEGVRLLRGGQALRAGRILARHSGLGDLEGSDLVEFIMDGFGVGKRGLIHMKERAAETSANFTMVAGLASTKAMFDGFGDYTPWSSAFLDIMEAHDFKTNRTASLQMGDFSSPAEGSAFSDLTIDDAGGSGSLVMRGSGVELTKQAIYNDELGLFFKRLANIGYLAAQHQDKLAATTIEASDFTAATAALALSGASLKTAWTNFMAITGPAGEKPGYVPRLLLAPSALYLTGLEITTAAQGETTASPLANGDLNAGDKQKMPLAVIHGLHLSDANDWYLLADPKIAPTWTYVKHSDYPVPQLFEVDSGLVASRKFRIEYPTAIITNHLNPGTNTKPVGAYKATQA